MSDNIRRLEDRVAEAATRLKRLSDEKALLQSEVTDLHERLATGTAGQAADGDQDQRQNDPGRALIAAQLREAMDILRDA